jgi:hypothetical protein
MTNKQLMQSTNSVLAILLCGLMCSLPLGAQNDEKPTLHQELTNHVVSALLEDDAFSKTEFSGKMRDRRQDFAERDEQFEFTDTVTGRFYDSDRKQDLLVFCGTLPVSWEHLLAVFVDQKNGLKLLDAETFHAKIGYSVSFRDIIGSNTKEIVFVQHQHAGTGIWRETTSIWSLMNDDLTNIFQIQSNRQHSVQRTRTWVFQTIQYPHVSRRNGTITVVRTEKQMKRTDGEVKTIDETITRKDYTWSKQKKRFVPAEKQASDEASD